VVQFGTLDKTMVRLLKQVLTEILTTHPDEEIREVFTRIAHIDKLRQLVEGLKLFLKHFLVGKKSSAEKNHQILVEKVDMVERILSRGKSHVLL